MRKLGLLFFILFFVLSTFCVAANDINYYQNNFLSTSTLADREGWGSYFNPATLGSSYQGLNYLYGPDETSGVVFSSHGFGVGVSRQEINGQLARDVRFNFCMKNIGFGFGWNNNQGFITTSQLYRLNNYFSFSTILSSLHKQYVTEIGYRPFGTEKLTLFADYEMVSEFYDKRWSAGILTELFDGMGLGVRYFDNKTVFASATMSLGHLTGLVMPKKINNGDTRLFYSYFVGEYRKNIIDPMINKDRYFLKLDLNKRITYQEGGFWRKNDQPLLPLLLTIRSAKNDPRIKGLLLDLTDIRASFSSIWEIREALKTFKKSNKRLLIYADSFSESNYYLATIADQVFMNEMGDLSLKGAVIGRTYYKKTLEKIGIGFEELRYFKYKTGVETFSKEKFSAADKEQLQAYLDSMVSTYVRDIESNRPIKKKALMTDLDQGDLILLNSDQAIEKGLIDKVCTFNGAINQVKSEENVKFKSAKYVNRYQNAQLTKWAPDKIAVVYALGICAMDTGIKAKMLSKTIKKLASRKDIQAIVLRVDSPGGSAMASELVAQAIQVAKSKMPVIVSQGQVAASGGYWLSMNAHEIVSTPFTLTGSIGVIGGFIYNKGLSETLGFTNDYIQKGKSADMHFGSLVPLLNFRIPNRKWTDKEKKSAETYIRYMYEKFISFVSKSRHLSVDQVDKIAQGRVWSGGDANKIGLVDRMGGLLDAIDIAKKSAGIKISESVIIEEYPKIGFWRSMLAFPGQAPLQNMVDQEMVEYLQFRLKHNGKGLYLY